MQSTLIKDTDILFNDADLKLDPVRKNYKGLSQVYGSKQSELRRTGTVPGKKSKELTLWTFLLILANLSLFEGSPAGHLAYNMQAVENGQWWRLFTFPFVHVSWYNLLLDGSAFLLLYHGLEEEMRRRRILYVVAAIAGSLTLPLICSPIIGNTGLAGLSGCAHGLMAITGLELIRRYPRGDMLKNSGYIIFAVVVIKSLIEAATGQVMFAGLHFGDVGTPVSESHLGGVIGGIGVYVFLCWKARR